jgi:glycosyltransferase involved in cell wall biosynthesis
MNNKFPRVAIVHEWLSTYAGSERVLEQLLNIWPDADLFCVVDFLDNNERNFLQGKQSTTTFIQKLPFAKKLFRSYLPLMPVAIEQLDLNKYDIIISSNHAVSKGVLTSPNQFHICYVHSPMRYIWDLQNQYLVEAGLTTGLKGIFVRLIFHYLRFWDVRSSNGVDYFIANSHFISHRISKCYRRQSAVIHPPVAVDKFSLLNRKQNFYFTCSRMVPYKKIPLIVEAFSKMPDRKLIVIGDGSDFKKAKSVAGVNVTLLGYQPDDVLIRYMQEAKAFVFAAEEDFGILPVEAQACGTPVIAYGKGGALETVIEGETGLFFHEQSISAIQDAVARFESEADKFKPDACRKNAERFSPEVFREKLRTAVMDAWQEFQSRPNS